MPITPFSEARRRRRAEQQPQSREHDSEKTLEVGFPRLRPDLLGCVHFPALTLSDGHDSLLFGITHLQLLSRSGYKSKFGRPED